MHCCRALGLRRPFTLTRCRSAWHRALGAAAAGRQRDEGGGTGIPLAEMLDDGVRATIEELAQRERVNRGYMGRVLRLTLLAPVLLQRRL